MLWHLIVPLMDQFDDDIMDTIHFSKWRLQLKIPCRFPLDFCEYFFSNSSSSSFILSNHIWHGIWGTLSDNTIEYKQVQRYR